MNPLRASWWTGRGPGFVALASLLKHQKGIITFGGSGAEIADELRTAGVHCATLNTMEQAIEHARTYADEGDVILLSPGCASFDAFKNFEHGDVFREAVLARST